MKFVPWWPISSQFQLFDAYAQFMRAQSAQTPWVVVLDDLSNGHRAAVGEARLVVADFADRSVLDELLPGEEIDVVVHMAALCEVGQSMTDPAGYYANNLTRSLALLDAVRSHGVRGVVFSSTAAVYGEPERVPIAETDRLCPSNPYGETKLAFERALAWYGTAYGLRYVALRYFNAAGAHPDGCVRPSSRTRRRRSSATTIRHATAPASATTCTSSIWPGRTCSRWRHCARDGSNPSP